MKKVNTKKTVKKFLTGAFASLLLVSTVAAEPMEGGKAPPAENPLHVEYMGVYNNYLVFKITVVSDSLKNSELLIGDGTSSIYTQGLSGSMTEKIEIEQTENQDLNFKLIAGKQHFSRSFTVNTVSVENTTVSEDSDTYMAR